LGFPRAAFVIREGKLHLLADLTEWMLEGKTDRLKLAGARWERSAAALPEGKEEAPSVQKGAPVKTGSLWD
jgi:hypothetical protein